MSLYNSRHVPTRCRQSKGEQRSGGYQGASRRSFAAHPNNEGPMAAAHTRLVEIYQDLK